MALARLNLTPVQASYGVQDTGADIVETVLDGGGPRQRVDVDGAARVATVRLALDAAQHSYLETFLHANRGQAFEFKLTNQYGEWQIHTVRAVPGSLRLSELRGTSRVYDLQLYVEPLARNADFDATILTIYDQWGENAGKIADLLEKAVNVHIAGWAS